MLREIAAFCAVLGFLVPIAVYCFILGAINRRNKPLIVSGAWDTVGLLFAGSGFFLITVPLLGGEFYRRAADIPDSSELFGPLLGSWIFWGCYFLLLTSGSTLMILWRAHKTVIYNVDASQFSHALQETLEEIHISATKNSQRFVLTPTAPDSNAGSTAIAEAKPKPAMDERCAEVSVDMFPALANVTLHWDNYAPDVRADVERDLERTLQLAAPAENPAAGWFLSISGLIFGALFMVILTIAFMLVFSTRR